MQQSACIEWLLAEGYCTLAERVRVAQAANSSRAL
jgi:hypothetical protein